MIYLTEGNAVIGSNKQFRVIGNGCKGIVKAIVMNFKHTSNLCLRNRNPHFKYKPTNLKKKA